MKKTTYIITITIVLVFTLLPVTVSGEGVLSRDGDIDEIIGDINGLIPDELRENFKWEDPLSYEYLSDFNGEFFINYLFSSFEKGISEFITVFAEILLIIILSALLENLVKGMGGNFTAAVPYVSAIFLCYRVFSRFNRLIFSAADTLKGMAGLFGSLSPVMSGIFLASGNVNSSVVAGAETLLIMNLINLMTDKILLPVLRVSFFLECIHAISGRAEISAAGSLVKRGFVYLSGGIMAILSAVFTYQTSIASGADSWMLRGAKFAANSIPVVGGAISEAARTIFGSFEVIKGVSGGVGIIIILLSVIPPIVAMIMYKIALFFSGSICDGIGCSAMSKILGGAGELMGFAIALVCIFSVGSIFTLTLIISMGG